jgi:peptidoglycan hydrolase-like protein with peptidoglycan-binding domain
VAAKPPAGSVDPNAGELGGKKPDELDNIKKNAGLPAAAPTGVQAQGDDEGNTMITRPDGTTMVVGPDGNAIKPGTNPNLPTNKAQAAALASGAQDDVTGVDKAVAANAAAPAAPTQAASPAAAKPKVMAKSDPAVLKIQQDLIAKGAKIKADGVMGDATRAAMKKFPGIAGGGQAASPTANPASSAKVPPMPDPNRRTGTVAQRDQWMAKYGNTHSMDGAPKAAAAAPELSMIDKFRKSVNIPVGGYNGQTKESIVTQDDAILAMIRNIRI